MTKADKVLELYQLIQFHRNCLNETQYQKYVSQADLLPHINGIKQARQLLKKIQNAKQLPLL